MSARDDILRALAQSARGPAPEHPSGLPGPVAVRNWAQRAARFEAAARAASATVECVTSAAAVATRVAAYLEQEGLAPRVYLSAAPPGLGEAAPGRLVIETGPLPPDGATLVTGCAAAIAEEGVVVLSSGPGHRPAKAFLAARHIVVVAPEQLLDTLEELWPRLGQARPWMTNLILGPSRTADLGVPSRLGAHGPLRLHVLLIGDARAPSMPATAGA